MNLQALENRVPPPVVGLLVALVMLATRLDASRLPLDRPGRIAIAAVLVAVGIGFSLPAVLAFRRARTTVNPVRIEQASTLVTGGIFRVSRNPMYVGLACLLAAWAVMLATPWAWLGPVAFVAFVTRFQIVPEERLLAARFGEAFQSWRRRVRRWL